MRYFRVSVESPEPGFCRKHLVSKDGEVYQIFLSMWPHEGRWARVGGPEFSSEKGQHEIIDCITEGRMVRSTCSKTVDFVYTAKEMSEEEVAMIMFGDLG